MNLGIHVRDKHLWLMCEVPTRVALCARSRVCTRHDLRTCKNEKTKIHVYCPPVIVCCSYAFVCNQPMYSCKTCILPYLVVCSRRYSYVTRMYSYVTRMYSHITRVYSYVTRMLLVCTRVVSKARFRRRTSHEPNRMQMRENKGFFSFAFDRLM